MTSTRKVIAARGGSVASRRQSPRRRSSMVNYRDILKPGCSSSNSIDSRKSPAQSDDNNEGNGPDADGYGGDYIAVMMMTETRIMVMIMLTVMMVIMVMIMIRTGMLMMMI